MDIDSHSMVSLKTIDTSLKTYSGGKGTEKIKEYIKSLNVDITIDNISANKILDVSISDRCYS